MLAEAQNYLREHHPAARLYAYGQDYNPRAYATAASDMLIKQVDHNGSGENVRFGDAFTDDRFVGETFDYFLTNPPFGVDWKKQQREIEKEHESRGYDGRFGAGLPRVNDGALLFLQHMISKFEPVQRAERKYGSRLAIVFSGSPLFTGGAGSGESEIRRWIIGNLEIAVPSIEYQSAIADYLDRETARIDALISAKERVLGLLAEKRQALITRAVTSGIERDVATRSSGVEWLPRVPHHWLGTKLRRLFHRTKRLGHAGLMILSVYRDFGVIERTSRDDNFNRIPDDLDKYQLVEVGDLVINKMKAWQGSLGVSALRGITSPDYVVFSPSHSQNPDFLHYFLRNRVLTTVYRMMSNGIRTDQWRLEPERFGELDVFLPPIDEQRAIVEYIKRGTTKLGVLGGATERTIDLLKERRAALIAAAVTGQIDVSA